MKVWVVEIVQTNKYGLTHVSEWVYGPSLTKSEVKVKAKKRLERSTLQARGAAIGSINLQLLAA